MEDSEIIDFTINNSNVCNESNALTITDKNDEQKLETASKQIDTITEQEYRRLGILHSKQQNKFNSKDEAEPVQITENLDQFKPTISSNEIETQIIVRKREIEKGLKNSIDLKETHLTLQNSHIPRKYSQIIRKSKRH